MTREEIIAIMAAILYRDLVASEDGPNVAYDMAIKKATDLYVAAGADCVR